jgi:hypothetical protein
MNFIIFFTSFLLLLYMSGDSAVSVYLCIAAFECRFSNWPCVSKHELNAAVLQEQSMTFNNFNFNNHNIINAALYVISYFLFSLCVLLFCLCILMFLCCLCNWPYGFCASTLIIKNRTELLLLLVSSSSSSS